MKVCTDSVEKQAEKSDPGVFPAGDQISPSKADPVAFSKGLELRNLLSDKILGFLLEDMGAMIFTEDQRR